MFRRFVNFFRGHLARRPHVIVAPSFFSSSTLGNDKNHTLYTPVPNNDNSIEPAPKRRRLKWLIEVDDDVLVDEPLDDLDDILILDHTLAVNRNDSKKTKKNYVRKRKDPEADFDSCVWYNLILLI